MEFLQHNVLQPEKPKRGRPRKEVKQIYIEDDIDEKHKFVLSRKFEEYNLQPINISDIIPNVIDGVAINIDNNTRTVMLTISPDFKSCNLSEWKRGIGGVFNNDVRKYIKDIECNEYFIISIPLIESFIIRKLKKCEYDEAALNDYNDIVINEDEQYSILKKVEGDMLTSVYNTLGEGKRIIFNTTEFKDEESENDESEEDYENEVMFYEE